MPGGEASHKQIIKELEGMQKGMGLHTVLREGLGGGWQTIQLGWKEKKDPQGRGLQSATGGWGIFSPGGLGHTVKKKEGGG